MLKHGITRRWFTAHLTLAAMAGPSGAASQTAQKVHRLGILCAYSCEYASATSGVMSTLVDALQKSGYVEGRNLRIDFGGAGVAAGGVGDGVDGFDGFGFDGIDRVDGHGLHVRVIDRSQLRASVHQ